VANYPAGPISFTNKVDGVDAVVAADVNVVYGEAAALGLELGLNPRQRSSSTWLTTWTSSGNAAHTDVKSRLDNVENGAFRANTLLVSNVGGSSIVASAANVKGLVIAGATSQSANLLELKATSAGDPVTLVTHEGKFITQNIDGGTSA